jgi:hypothetical protein
MCAIPLKNVGHKEFRQVCRPLEYQADISRYPTSAT